MIEVPIDYVKPGDRLGKYHAFRKYEGGMSYTVDLIRGYYLTEKVIRKLKQEYRVEYLVIDDPNVGPDDVTLVESFDEAKRQQGLGTIIHSMNRLKSTKSIDLKTIGAVVEDILKNVFSILKNGKGSFRVLSNTFLEVQSHDFYTWEHSVNTAMYAAIIALSAPWLFEGQTEQTYSAGRTTRLENLVMNMLLHDIGKIKISEEVLNKPGRLNKRQMDFVKRHPYFGFAYMREINKELENSCLPWIPSYYMRACLYHHQAYDGSGYPALKTPGGDVRTLKAKEIPLIGRIAAIADVYDALSSVRPFRKPFHPLDAIRILRTEKGRRLDPEITEAFVKTIYPFPVGTTVSLSTRELAVVVGYVDDNKFQPIVRPIMKKVVNNGKEDIVRLQGIAQNMSITPDSKVKILVNKDIYHLRDEYYETVLK